MSSRPTIEGGGWAPDAPKTKADQEVIDKYGDWERPAPTEPTQDNRDGLPDVGLTPIGGEDGSSVSGSFWESWVSDYVRDELKLAAKNLGINYGDQLGDFVNSFLPDALAYVRTNYADWLQTVGPFPNLEDPFAVLDPQSEAALDTLGLAAMNWMKREIPDLAKFWRQGKSDPFGRTPSGGGRRGGGGGRALTAADFDADYIAEQVQELWQAYLLDDNPDPRSLAKAYINARVANPESPLELETFVLGRIRNTGRYRSIYRSKPEGVNELTFMNRYLSTARQYLSEGRAQDVAIGGAQFAASPGAFNERISREREVQTTAPFIAGLEQTMAEVRGVFRG